MSEGEQQYSIYDALLLAVKMHKAGKINAASDIYLKVLQVEPNNFNALHLLGIAKQQNREIEAGEKLILQSIKSKPDFPEAHYSLSVLYKEAGRIEESLEAGKNAVEHKPDHAEAHHVISSLYKYKDKDDPHIKQMEEALKFTSIDENYKLYLHFGLAKAYNDLGDKEEAFKHFKIANDKKRSTYEYDISETEQQFKKIKKIFTKDFTKKHHRAGFKNDRMIFILGMPRSGTTLIDQILCSHSQVESAGELDTLKYIIHSPEFPENFKDLTNHNMEEIGHNFIQHIDQINIRSPFLIDKMPDNFRFTGAINLILPNARIIHCKRNKFDTCVSIYTNHFSGTQKFSYNQTELGKYYKLYEDLMEFWKTHLAHPENFIEVEYEKVIEDQEGESRRLIEFLGLDWEDNCLEFYKTKRTITTASTIQVRKPIYKSSVNRWKKNKKYIKDLIKELEG